MMRSATAFVGPSRRSSKGWVEGLGLVVLEGRIQGVILETGDFITREGVKVGSTRAEVLRVFGSTFRAEPERIWYEVRGIGFWFQGDRVRQIQVVSGQR